PSDSPIYVGGHGCGMAIQGLPGWKADRDPSIRATGGRKQCEFVSPIYRGSEGVAQLIRDLAIIRSMGAQVNDSCGLHTHAGFNPADGNTMARLITLVANFEKAIYASTGTKKRERGRWCNGVARHGSISGVENSNSRYHVLNIHTQKPTVEFRAFGGSLNIPKIVSYVRLCVAIVERALRAKKVTNWTAKQPTDTSPIHREGPGQTALARLSYQLLQTKGRPD